MDLRKFISSMGAFYSQTTFGIIRIAEVLLRYKNVLLAKEPPALCKSYHRKVDGARFLKMKYKLMRPVSEEVNKQEAPD